MAGYKTLRFATVIMFGVVLVIFMAVRSGMLTFIVLFVTDHLDGSEEVGSFLISAYFAGEVLYRLFASRCLCDCLRNKMRSPSFLIFGYVVLTIIFCGWMAVSSEELNIPYLVQISVMFIVFGSSGFVCSTTYPAVYELCESIVPINGFAAGAFTICLGIGDLLVLLLMGEVIDIFGVSVQPMPLVALCVLQIAILGLTAILYRRYKAHEARVLQASPKYKMNIDTIGTLRAMCSIN